MSLFDRVASVDVQAESGKALHIEGNRISFDVTKTRTEASNTAEVLIYNLSAESRARLQERNAFVRLFAGYRENTGLEALFIGEADFIHSRREIPDIVTKIEIQDGIKELREYRVSLSYKPGATAQQVLQGIASALSLPLRSTVSAAGEYPRGYSFLGPAKESLDQVCRKAGLEWSIQDGSLLILPMSSDAGNVGLLISPETGLIGSAERINYSEGELAGDMSAKPQWKIVSLLQPKVLPAHRIKIRSADLNGYFVVDTVRHRGDTRGHDWYTEMELLRISNG